jgi:hypothetical protein
MSTLFIDALTTIDPNNSNGLGLNWMQGAVSTVNNNNPAGAAAKIAVATKDGLNCLAWQGYAASGASDLLRAYALPIPIYFDVRGKSQFIQCTNVKLAPGSDSSNLDSGLMVQFYPSSPNLNTYLFFINTARAWVLYRINDGGFTTLTSGSAGADGDIWKFSSDLSNPSQVVLNVTRNGNALTSYTDTSSSRLNYGSPAMYCQFDNNISPAYSEWRTFSAGAL